MCKHLPGYPPHLGALAHWMYSILYPHMVDQCIILTLLSFQPSLLGRLLYFHTSPKNPISSWLSQPSLSQPVCEQVLLYEQRTKTLLGLAIQYLCGWAVKVYSFSVDWCYGCCVRTCVWGVFLLCNTVRLSHSWNFWSCRNYPTAIQPSAKSRSFYSVPVTIKSSLKNNIQRKYYFCSKTSCLLL